jgi:hypothetical protein
MLRFWGSKQKARLSHLWAEASLENAAQRKQVRANVNLLFDKSRKTKKSFKPRGASAVQFMLTIRSHDENSFGIFKMVRR